MVVRDAIYKQSPGISRGMGLRTLAVVLVLAFAGCSGGGGGGGGETTTPTDTLPSGSTTPPASTGPKPSPVDISDGGDMLGGVTQDWEWKVSEGFVNHTIEIKVQASNGAPLVVMECVYARLEHGGVTNEQGNAKTGPACTAQQTQMAGCFFCKNGLADGIGAGNYTLHFEASQGSIGAYTAEIHVSY